MKPQRGRPRGHKLSQETRNKISNSMMGHEVSKETKAKISMSLSLYWANRPKACPNCGYAGCKGGWTCPGAY